MFYFPRPYPDEVVGSLVLRSCRHLGLPYKRVIQRITTTIGAYSSFLLPSNLQMLGSLTGMNPEQLLWEHTIFPYVVAFMSPAEATRLQDKILGPLSGSDSFSSLTKSVTHGTPFRRFCPECIRDDLEHVGETYWHRAHLLPGNHLCLIHHCLLMETTIPLRGVASRNTQMPSDVAGNPYNTRLSWHVLKKLAEQSEKALTQRLKVPTGYRSAALHRGYKLAGGDVAGRHLTCNLHSFYPKEFLVETGCYFDQQQRHPWPALLARGDPSFPSAPPKHVLMATFLECAAHTNRNGQYGTPGPKVSDYATADRRCVEAAKAVLSTVAATGTRITVRALMIKTGYWSSVRHHRQDYPLTDAFLREFLRSELSERQAGRRPRRKRPPALKPRPPAED